MPTALRRPAGDDPVWLAAQAIAAGSPPLTAAQRGALRDALRPTTRRKDTR